MDIKIGLSRDFERCLEDLKKKYGEDFEYINGVHPSQLDSSEFINNFVDDGVLADKSIDPNANVQHKDIRSFLSEKDKSINKIFGLNKIFYEIKKKWGLKTAKAWLEQEFSKGFYLNDSTTSSFFAYCWANDLSRLAKEGLFFIKDYNNQPPKHLVTFLDDVIEFISFLSNRQSGAVGLVNVLVWSWWFWKKDVEEGYYLKDPKYYLKQSFQKLIFRLNQPFLRIDQAAFTNVSIFDRCYLESLFGGMEMPDGTFVIDHIEDLIDVQKMFMEVVSDIRTENMFTYPVLTYSLLYKDGKFQDEDFARWCSKHNMKWSDSNFFVSDNVGVLSNCPLGGDTPILYWSDYYKEYKVSSIKSIYYDLDKKDEKTIKTLSNGREIRCKINKFNMPADYEIELVNGVKFRTTANHLNKVYGKDYVETKDLTTDDYLPYTLQPYEISKSMSYEDGKLVGMFLGDGSYRNASEITFSLNSSTDADDIEFLYDYCVKKFGAKITKSECVSEISGKKSCVNVNVNSEYLRGLISQFVVGKDALHKQISYRVLHHSLDFRHGILDGLYTTDGGNSNRIYTSSELLKDSLMTMLASMGIASTFGCDDREGRLGTNTNYVIRWYTPNGRTKRKDVYIVDDEYFWFRIKSINKIDNVGTNPVSFCIEVLDSDVEPVFMLPNGVHTHNCRLLSSTKNLDVFINSIGGTALSVGSCRVNTINLVRIAYESECDKKKYLKILKDRTLLNCKSLYCMRHIIKRNIEKGLLPNYIDGAVELDKQFCTIGGIGMYETLDMFGFINEDELGNKSYSDEGLEFAIQILDTINEIKDNFTDEFRFNLEMIPAENCAGVICKADNLLFNQNKYFIYSNQWIPLTTRCTIQEKCRLGSYLDKKCGGGTIAHINIENRFATEDAAWDMLNYVASQGVIYFAFTTKINVCKDKHAFIGTQKCPICGGEKADTYARVVG